MSYFQPGKMERYLSSSEAKVDRERDTDAKYGRKKNIQEAHSTMKIKLTI